MNEAERQLVIEQELQKAPGDPSRLPDLVDDPPAYMEWIERLVKWLTDLFPGDSWNGADISGEAIWNFFQILGIAVLVLIVLIIIYILYRNVQGLRPVRTDVDVPGAGMRRADVADEWQEAVAAGDWAKAMRLRWAMFLRQSPLPPSLTVREYAAWGRVSPDKAMDYTRGMYRPGDANEPLHGDLDSQLSRDEKEMVS